MSTDLPLHLFIGQMILHTPAWVWALLVFITAIGLRQRADHVMGVRRLTLVPLAWGALSVWSATSSFGVQVGVLAAWAAGTALAVAGNQWLAWPRGAQALGGGRYAIPGSLWPLLAMWSVFVVRYLATVVLQLDPTLRHSNAMGLAISLTYGLLSGIFLARSVRILRSAPTPGALVPA
jgi:hypothetical protein